LIEAVGGDSSGRSETEKTSQTTRSGGDGLSLTPRKASAYSENQLYFIPCKIYITLVSLSIVSIFFIDRTSRISSISRNGNDFKELERKRIKSKQK